MHPVFFGVVTLVIACLAFHIIPLFRWLCIAALVAIALLIINAKLQPPTPEPPPMHLAPALSPQPQLPVQRASLPSSLPAQLVSDDCLTRLNADYCAAVSNLLVSHTYYSDDARRRGEKGYVVLRLRVDYFGRVLNSAIVSGSGFADLDQAALDTIKYTMLPPMPGLDARPPIEVVTTIRFGA